MGDRHHGVKTEDARSAVGAGDLLGKMWDAEDEVVDDTRELLWWNSIVIEGMPWRQPAGTSLAPQRLDHHSRLMRV